jgi:hypothetical protein
MVDCSFINTQKNRHFAPVVIPEELTENQMIVFHVITSCNSENNVLLNYTCKGKIIFLFLRIN